MTGRLKLLIKLPCGVFEWQGLQKFLKPGLPPPPCELGFKFCPFLRTPRSWLQLDLSPRFRRAKLFHCSGVGTLTRPVSANTSYCPSILEYHGPIRYHGVQVRLALVLRTDKSIGRETPDIRCRSCSPWTHRAARRLGLSDYGHKPCCLWGKGGESYAHAYSRR